MHTRKLSPDPDDLEEGEQPEDEPIGDWSTDVARIAEGAT